MLSQFPGFKWAWLVGVGAFIDQLSKAFVLNSLHFAELVPVFPGLNITLSFNPGIAFGWFNSGSMLMQTSLLTLTALITLGLFMWLLKTPRQMFWQSLGLASIVGGALGNLFDRIFRGHVVDFIDFYANNWHWHTFNIADSLISVGAFLLIIAAFKKEESHS